MAEDNKYGDLTDDELRAFINEIEDEDDDLLEKQVESISKIATQSSIEDEEPVYEETLTDGAWSDTMIWLKDEETGKSKPAFEPMLASDIKAKQIERSKRGVAAYREICRQARIRKIELKRAAFNQTDIQMSDAITKQQMQTLISLLTVEHRVVMDRCTTYINKRLTKLLLPLIPRIVKMCYNKHKHCMKSHPGFMYFASAEYGRSKTFWATPDVPYYFVQGTEQELIVASKKDFAFNIDKAVAQFDSSREALAKSEIKIASRLVQMKKCTFYELLKLNPLWFEALYNEITKKQLLDGQNKNNGVSAG